MKLARIVALVAAVAGVVVPGSGHAASAVQGSCGTGALVILFWPSGHRAIPSLGFPAFQKPHVELYRFAGASTYRPAKFLAYLGVDGKPVLKCREPGAPSSLKPVVPRRTSTAKAAVSCGFRGAAIVQMLRVAGPWHLRIFDSAGLVADAKLAPGGSTISTSSARCRTGRAPG